MESAFTWFSKNLSRQAPGALENHMQNFQKVKIVRFSVNRTAGPVNIPGGIDPGMTGDTA